MQNAETLAHLALIARYGPAWFRELGTPEEPGSALVTISGAVGEPGVYEVELGTPLRALLDQAGGTDEPLRALLVGGYFGTWIGADDVDRLRLLNVDLRRVGASLGARAVVALPVSACGVCETARAARYLAAESAGQCGQSALSTVSRRSPTFWSRSPPAATTRAARDCRVGSPM